MTAPMIDSLNDYSNHMNKACIDAYIFRVCLYSRSQAADDRRIPETCNTFVSGAQGQQV